MSIDLAPHIARLTTARDRLAAIIAERPGGDTAIPQDQDRLAAAAERNLADDPLQAAWRALTDAIAALEDVRAELFSEAEGKSLEEPCSAPRGNRLETAPFALPSSAALAPPSLREVQRVALSLRGDAASIETTAATIHPGPPDAWRNARGAETSAPRADDLTEIRGIDRKLAEALVARGIRTFREIAAFGPADVRTLSAALGLGRRISAENWIEQASMLWTRAKARHAEAEAAAARPLPVSMAAPGLDTAFESVTADIAAATLALVVSGSGDIAPRDAEGGLPPMIRAAAERIATRFATAADQPAQSPPGEPCEASAAPRVDRSSLAMAVGRAATAIAAAAAVRRAAEATIETGSTADVPAPAASHDGSDGTPTQTAPFVTQQPIDDPVIASVEVDDHPTTPSLPFQEGSPASPAPIIPEPAAALTEQVPEPEHGHTGGEPVTEATPLASADVPADMGTADAQPAGEPAEIDPITPSSPTAPAAEPTPAPDDLAAIRGMDAVAAAGLARLGITRYAEIAAWGPREVESIRQALGPAARISREGWIEQAAVLARGQTTAYVRQLRSGASTVAAPRSQPARDPVFALWLARQTSELPIPKPVRAPEPPASLEPEAESQHAAAETAGATTSFEAPTEPDTAAPAVGPVDGFPVSEPEAAPTVAEASAPSIEPPAAEDDALLAAALARSTAPVPTFPLTPPPLPENAAAAHTGEVRHDPFSLAPPEAARSSPPETPRTTPLQSISDRMQAIERDLATLDIVPIAPSKSRRMALPVSDSAARSATADAALPPDLVPTEIVFEPAPSQPATADDDALFDFTARRADEAAVTIVRRAARETGLDPLPVTATAEEPEFDRAEYAAYRGRVEEAMVEIVKPGSGPTSGTSAPAEASDAEVSDADNPVRRFLKALSGA